MEFSFWWGKGNFQINDKFLGSDVVGVKGMWKEEMEETIIVNIYSFFNMEGTVWNELVDIKTRWGDGSWVVVGDFNAIRKKEERKERNNLNSATPINEIVEFNDFIDKMGIQDIPLIG